MACSPLSIPSDEQRARLPQETTGVEIPISVHAPEPSKRTAIFPMPARDPSPRFPSRSGRPMPPVSPRIAVTDGLRNIHRYSIKKSNGARLLELESVGAGELAVPHGGRRLAHRDRRSLSRAARPRRAARHRPPPSRIAPPAKRRSRRRRPPRRASWSSWTASARSRGPSPAMRRRAAPLRGSAAWRRAGGGGRAPGRPSLQIAAAREADAAEGRLREALAREGAPPRRRGSARSASSGARCGRRASSRRRSRRAARPRRSTGTTGSRRWS
jgi:hypothetical protein